MIVDAVTAVIWLAEVVCVAYVGYRICIGSLGLLAPRHRGLGEGDTFFLLLIAAHNEEGVIAETVRRVSSLNYPIDRRVVAVVADRCDDNTEAAAAAAGAIVLSKSSRARGKGPAVRWALRQPTIRKLDWEAVVVLDADSWPDQNFLRYMDSAVQHGALAIQGRSESGGQAGWVARGYTLNAAQRNRTWHQAREAAGFSAILTGTGMCLTRKVLTAYPIATTTLTEDLEYSAFLTANGVRIHYLYPAVLHIQEPHSLGSSVNQRLRWGRGQLQTALIYGPKLLLHGIFRLRPAAIDTALYLPLPSVVPLQAFLITALAGSLILGSASPHGLSIGPVPPGLIAAVLLASVILPFLAILRDGRKSSPLDWLSFLMLMLTWMPTAVVAAATISIKTWHRTPHFPREAERVAQPALTDSSPSPD